MRSVKAKRPYFTHITHCDLVRNLPVPELRVHLHGEVVLALQRRCANYQARARRHYCRRQFYRGYVAPLRQIVLAILLVVPRQLLVVGLGCIAVYGIHQLERFRVLPGRQRSLYRFLIRLLKNIFMKPTVDFFILIDTLASM